MNKKLLATMLALTIVLGATGCSKSDDKATSNDGANDTAAVFTAGEYTAAGEGKNGAVNVTVKFDDSKIVSVEVGDHAETAGLADPAIEGVPAAIVEGQTLKVDVVSGATVTSEAIIAAVEDCITQAGANAADFK
ncbi:MAG: FMN-binding protein [Lachnospiraceae bacterium]|nr:FMN-binding protein [Lachnospiraceae bacterium]